MTAAATPMATSGGPGASQLRVEPLDLAAPLTREWDALVARTQAPPFARPGWLDAWWRAFGRGTPLVVTARLDGRLAGVLPLGARLGELDAPANGHTPAVAMPAETDDVAAALVECALALTPRRLALGRLDAPSGTARALASAARRAGYLVTQRPDQRSPYVALEATFEAYEAGLDRKFLANVRRCQRRLADAGAAAVEVNPGARELDARLEEGLHVEPSGWKARRGTAIASRADTVAFYARVARWAAREGLLRLVFLRLERRAIAFHFALEDARAYYLLKGGYDPAFQRLAPGKLLIHSMLARSFRLGQDRFEFLGADEPWKASWAPTCHERLAVTMWAPTVPARAERAALDAVERYGRPLARQIRARR